MKLHHAPEVDRAEDIDVVHNEGFFRTSGILDRTTNKEMSGLFQATAGVEQYVLTRDFNAHLETVVRLQVLLNHVGEVVDVDYHLADSKFAQARKRDLQ